MSAALTLGSPLAALQTPGNDIDRGVWDAVVIGAGPAGSVTALHLALKGHRVLLLDKDRFPRDKTCGDGLLQDAQRVLCRLGLLREAEMRGHRVGEVSWFSPAGIECRVPGDFLILRRRWLDALLARRAVEAGVVFCHGQVERIIEDGEIADVELKSGQRCRARVGVIATGASVDLLNKLGFVTRRQASGVALRCYVRSTLDLARLVVVYERATVPGYSWIFPMGDGQFNVGSSRFNGANDPINLRAMFQSFCERFPIACELMSRGTVIAPPRGAQLRCGLNGVEMAGNRLLAIGESAGSTYPSTGEGIGKAMEMGELAAEAIDEDLRRPESAALRNFPMRIETMWRSRFKGYELASRWLSRSWLNDLVAWRGQRSPAFRDAMANVFQNDADPSKVFCLGGILKSFWR